MRLPAHDVVPVRAGGGRGDYEVLVGRGLLGVLPGIVAERAPAHRYAVISDDRVAPLHAVPVVEALTAAGVACDLLTFPAGEANKTRAAWTALTDALLERGHGRDSVVVAVGGGVTGDLAGFVAASFMRGVPVVQVPTSLVAMVDASIGGKTGVDVPAGKNLVGAFHPPAVVVADPDTLATLPRGERAQGLAEAVKHGAILDADYLSRIERAGADLLHGTPEALDDLVLRSVQLKADIVSRDEMEGGLREILNFGHTLGHALEAEADWALPHGSAVALGMVLEARIGEDLGVTDRGTARRLARIVEALELPSTLPIRLEPRRVVERTRADKKARSGRARYVLLECAGTVARHGGRWSREVDDALAVRAF